MYCNNCGNLIVGSGITCTNCGVTVQSGNSIAELIDEKKSASQILEEIYELENKRKDLDSVSYVVRNNDDFKLIAEQITIKEREKRITEERIKKEIDFAKQQREQSAFQEPVKISSVNEARIVG